MEKAKTFINENIALLGLVAVLLLGVLINPLFKTPENLSNLLRTTSITGFVAIGMTFVILCGSIDLSVSSVFSLSGFLFIYFSQQSDVLAILVPLIVGMSIGLLNGILITRFSIPAFIGTLATMLFFRGLVLVLTNENTYKVKSLSSFLYYFGRGDIIQYVSFPLVMFIIALLITSYILRRRTIGRAMYIVGGNAEAAKMMGINVSATLIIAHVISSFMASFGGIFLASRVGAAYPLSGTGYELIAIAAVVIGGARLTGGVGRISGTLIGVLIMGAFSNIFNLQRFLDPVWELVVVGTVLLVVVVLQAVVTKVGVQSKNKEKTNNGNEIQQKTL